MSDTFLHNMAKTHICLAKKLCFMDAGVWLGPLEGFPLAAELVGADVGDVLEKHLCTRSGLVSHWWGKTLSPQAGNATLAAALADMPGDFHGVYTGLPLLPGEIGVPFAEAVEFPRMKGVRIFPKSHGFPLSAWMIADLCEALVSHGIPLFIWHVELEWNSLRNLALQYPSLTIVVESQVQKLLYATRPLVAVMRECANVCVETSNLVGIRLVEYFAREVGAERLIYGSFLPVSDPYVPMGMILDAELTDAQKRMIAGDNLRGLLEGGAQ